MLVIREMKKYSNFLLISSILFYSCLPVREKYNLERAKRIACFRQTVPPYYKHIPLCGLIYMPNLQLTNIPCSYCDRVLSNTFDYRYHQVADHSKRRPANRNTQRLKDLAIEFRTKWSTEETTDFQKLLIATIIELPSEIGFQTLLSKPVYTD